jgi:hypothetical protein
MVRMAEVRPAEFARMCGVSPSVISRKIQANTLVRNAAGLLDTDNPVNSRYASRRRLKSNVEALEDDGKNAERVLKQVDFSTFDDYEIADRVGLPQKMLGMSIRELVVKYRGMEGLETYVKMLRDLTAADEKDQRVQERRLQLIEKDFIVARVFQFLDVLMRQILEYPESAVDGIISLVQSEGIAARTDVTAKMRSGLTGIVKGAKDVVLQELSGLKAKHQGGDEIEEKLEAIAERLDAKD